MCICVCAYVVHFQYSTHYGFALELIKTYSLHKGDLIHFIKHKLIDFVERDIDYTVLHRDFSMLHLPSNGTFLCHYNAHPGDWNRNESASIKTMSDASFVSIILNHFIFIVAFIDHDDDNVDVGNQTNQSASISRDFPLWKSKFNSVQNCIWVFANQTNCS